MLQTKKLFVSLGYHIFAFDRKINLDRKLCNSFYVVCVHHMVG